MSKKNEKKKNQNAQKGKTKSIKKLKKSEVFLKRKKRTLKKPIKRKK
tara:strand:+ start:542 stop:682 length:141 start_codon:yes stop_codon:yes gene_type:complete